MNAINLALFLSIFNTCWILIQVISRYFDGQGKVRHKRSGDEIVEVDGRRVK